MLVRARPTAFLEHLIAVVGAARRTTFWSARLGDLRVSSLTDFDRLPETAAECYRKQRFDAVVAFPEDIEWIPGPLLGQSPHRVPVVEGSAEAQVRVGLVEEAVRTVVQSADVRDRNQTAVVVATSLNRHFGAEMCGVFIRIGVPAHLVVDTGTERLQELIDLFQPDIVAALSPMIDIQKLPPIVRGVVTVGRGALSGSFNHVDLCVQNELGVLGHTTIDGRRVMNHHRFHFEVSSQGTLLVTPYFAITQPMVRLDTGISASVIH